jgi:hypothetical protein
VIAQVQTNAVRSLRHQHRDPTNQLTPYLSEDQDSSYYQVYQILGLP